MTSNEWYHRFDGAVSVDVISSIQSDARAGMIEVSELDATIKSLDFTIKCYNESTSFEWLDGLRKELTRLKALRNEHPS